MSENLEETNEVHYELIDSTQYDNHLRMLRLFDEVESSGQAVKYCKVQMHSSDLLPIINQMQRASNDKIFPADRTGSQVNFLCSDDRLVKVVAHFFPEKDGAGKSIVMDFAFAGYNAYENAVTEYRSLYTLR